MDAYRASSYTFYFLYEGSQLVYLHIGAEHGTTAQDAIDTFFDGWTQHNTRNARFETFTTSHGLYWTWLHGDEASTNVLVISCFTL